MRYIKFRCWFDNHMFRVVDIDFSYKRINLFAADIIHFKDGVLMQYTGLKDKNGKEIYEGDILKYTFDGEEKIDYIEYQGNMFTYHNAVRWSLQEDEVIGNIYENPELLEIQN